MRYLLLAAAATLPLTPASTQAPATATIQASPLLEEWTGPYGGVPPWDKATADRFARLLLSTGNETDRAEAYRAFRGRDPDINALLRKRGFPTVR